MADDPTTTQKNNTEAIKALTKKIAESKRQAKMNNMDDPASLSSYLREQTVGRINIKRMLPPALQGALGVASDIREIMKAKKIKRSMDFASDDLDDLDETESNENTTSTKPVISTSEESNNTLLEKIVESLELQTGLLEKISTSTGFIWELMQENAFNRELESLNDLENEREKSRIGKDTKVAVEENAETNEESGGFLSGLLDFFKGGSFLSSLLGGLGLTGITATLGSIVGPLLAFLGAAALGGIIVYEISELVSGLKDLRKIQKETKQVVKDQIELTKRREKNDMVRLTAGETKEDYVLRAIARQVETQEMIEGMGDNETMFVVDPDTLEGKNVTKEEALKMFSKENLQRISNNLDPEYEAEAFTKQMSGEQTGTSTVDIVEGNEEEIRKEYYRMSLPPDQREIYDEAERKDRANKATKKAYTGDEFSTPPVYLKITDEEQALLDWASDENTERTAMLGAIYTAALDLYNNNEWIRLMLVPRGIPYGKFDPGDPEQYKILLQYADVVYSRIEQDAGPSYRATFTAKRKTITPVVEDTEPTIEGTPVTREVTQDTDNMRASAAGSNIGTYRGGDNFTYINTYLTKDPEAAAILRGDLSGSVLTT